MLSALLRAPQVAFAWAVDRLRRLPGANLAGRLGPWLVGLLVVAAGVAFVVWMIQPSPQRISLAELAAGQLSRMQSWIIVSGDLQEVRSAQAEVHLYRLTDPTVPLANLVVRSERPLPVGWTTVSGFIEGGRDPVPAGYEWSARLEADPVVAAEAPPPWAAGLLALGAAIVVAARRSAYPVFVRERPGTPAGRRGELRVGVRGEASGSDEPAIPARLDLGRWPGDVVSLRVGTAAPGPVRLHSAHTSAEVGLLRWIRRSAPALRVRGPGEDLMIEFASRNDRDAAHDALTVEVRERGTARRA